MNQKDYIIVFSDPTTITYIIKDDKLREIRIENSTPWKHQHGDPIPIKIIRRFRYSCIWVFDEFRKGGCSNGALIRFKG
ncbi:uncharacterized protein TA19135 [Theileria annulata]|uniref:Uncharacterized protein n=1 Tax=Theileria annulata TaxID=5874 RepID=Q4UGA4_THEAN|nr:uncharacterized protein TA19135 [Theileria annulata]CAI73885.1 hypothetical protein TA19135 [Theileria annulata]|eukprot:XP_954562.1 hypothetical protein TA19135 [Theileria annulata]